LVRWPEAFVRAAAGLAQARGATLFMALLAGFVALLHRYTGQEDFALGSPIANRTRPELFDLIGFFVNTLVLRGDITGDAGDPAFTDLLARLRQTALSAYAHQDLPFERLVEELAPERSLGQAPLFQVMFALMNRGAEPLALPGLTLEAVPVETGRAKFDLMVTLAETAAGVSASWEHDVDLFDRATIERMATAYERLLAAAVERSAARLSELPLLSDEERRQLLVQWSVPAVSAASVAPYPLGRTIHSLFLEQAARTPQAEALVLGEASMTYGELARRAGQVARFLAGEGIGAGDRVAIFLEHSFAMVEAVLGALLSGAAYVPLDPEHPKGRLELLLADSGARLALTTAALVDRLPEGTRSVRLDADRETIERAAAALPETDPQGSQAVAYVLYTSGSTGRPKGVKVRHRSLVNYISWAREVYLQGEPLSFALYTSLAFDLTVTSLFTPLLSGSRLFLYPRREGEYPLLDILADDRAEVLKLTPSHLELIKERDNRKSRVRRLIVGGEALSAALAGQIEKSFDDQVEIYNEYGPTEATVGCMLHRFGPDDRRRAFVPIGGPAANVRLYVLDASLQPVAEGLPGELYVGGECLAEGYLGLDALTAERFLAEPFVPGERVYRTGDRVRRLPGGLFDFLGRSDEQVKIRGHRIELGEIRVALNRHAGVRDSVVRVAEE
ncbi:MAG TPA: amino acid adenylation domain-containing protein, partial [Thermoanaerobaculia bacterium]|nr:amino acid adenylation domain-containing protein [Thermoanaerobaculia bacterium]